MYLKHKLNIQHQRTTFILFLGVGTLCKQVVRHVFLEEHAPSTFRGEMCRMGIQSKNINKQVS